MGSDDLFKKRMREFEKNKENHIKQKPSEYDPGTTFYKLVEALYQYLDE